MNCKTSQEKGRKKGFSTLELLVVMAVTLVIAGIAVPGMVQTWYDLQLRASAGQVADLMQQARMTAARANVSPGVPIRYRVTNGMQQVYADINQSTQWDTWTPANGQPCDNTCTLAFSPRGLPCVYTGAGNPCTTPSASYFVYYFNDGRPSGWAAVLVSKAGRTRVLLWNGTSWK